MQERIWYLKNCDLLGQLSEEQLSALEKRCQMREFPAGNPIYLPSEAADSMFLIATGLVKICHLTVEGKTSTLTFIKPGEVFGELSLFDTEQRGEYVESVEPSTIIRMPKEEIQRLMNGNTSVAMRVTKLVGLRRQKIEQRIRHLLFTSNQHRLSHLLLDLADQFGVPIDDGGIQLGLKLSHQEIANLIGTTRETVTLMLGKMRSEGLIRGQRQTVILCDIKRLAESVGRANGNIPA